MAVMRPDDKVCYCYGVSLRKLWNFARQRRPARASQMSECLGAGTGCGWCIPFLKRLHAKATEAQPDAAGMEQETSGEAQQTRGEERQPVEELIKLTPEEYAEQRRSYISEGKAKNTF